MPESILVFEKFSKEYDGWYDANRFAYESEINCLKKFIPNQGMGIEVGAGTGRFSIPFGIKVGIEPAWAMTKIAKSHGIQVCGAVAESLPIIDQSYDFVLFATTICFVYDLEKSLQEARRILKKKGKIIIAMVDKDTPLGRNYESKKNEGKFTRFAHFYSINEILESLKSLQFTRLKVSQTIFDYPENMTSAEPCMDGYGKGLFVILSGIKS
jgi:ubiquinone/menaquinone biosynthesis C-methylase UbiE